MKRTGYPQDHHLGSWSVEEVARGPRAALTEREINHYIVLSEVLIDVAIGGREVSMGLSPSAGVDVVGAVHDLGRHRAVIPSPEPDLSPIKLTLLLDTREKGRGATLMPESSRSMA